MIIGGGGTNPPHIAPRYAGDRAVQFHGGMGFTWECDAQLFLRRALFAQSQFGDAMHQRKKLADLLLGTIEQYRSPV